MQVNSKIAGLPMLVVVVGILLVFSEPAFAENFVKFVVSIDGKVVLVTSTGDEGEGADTVWRYLLTLTFRPVTKEDLRSILFKEACVEGYKVEADRGDPLRAMLKGKLLIESADGGRAEVTELKLVRANDSTGWKVAPSEVERTFKSRKKPNNIRVSINRRFVLYRFTYTSQDADTAWRDMKQLDLWPYQSSKIKADSGDPLRATLRGKVTIDAGNAGRAEVSELKLVREKVNALWKIDPAEVERTFKSRRKSD
jgi:hypothetical protein